MSMWDRLKDIEARFEEIAAKLATPEVASSPKLIQSLSKEHKSLREMVATYRSHKKASEELKDANEMLSSTKDPEIVEMAKEEVRMLELELGKMEEALKVMLIPKDPNDDKNVIVEIRAGAGGDEASLFAGELFRMYARYAERRGWKVELMSTSEGTAGGFKEVIAMISGDVAFSRLKYERGVHRVQRVPKTETAGRIHTSTVTVAMLPEAEEIDVKLEDKDLRIDVYRSGGPGGQSVNTTDSAVRITHLPTGIVVAMQDEKSQLKNREKAFRVLRARILEAEQARIDAERRADRRSQVGTGDRSEKIRTYNFPQSRVTDHRIGLTVQAIDSIMDGNIDQVVDPLVSHYQAEALKGES